MARVVGKMVARAPLPVAFGLDVNGSDNARRCCFSALFANHVGVECKYSRIAKSMVLHFSAA